MYFHSSSRGCLSADGNPYVFPPSHDRAIRSREELAQFRRTCADEQLNLEVRRAFADLSTIVAHNVSQAVRQAFADEPGTTPKGEELTTGYPG